MEKNSITKMKGWQRRLIISERAHVKYQDRQLVNGTKGDLVFDFHQVIECIREQDSAGVRNELRIADLNDNFDDFRQKFVRLVQLTTVQFPSLDVCIESELQKYKKYAEKLTSLGLVCNTVRYLHDALSGPTPKNVLVEGANGTFTYPYVTRNNCSVGGVLTGLGINPRRVSHIIGIVKAYETRVGDGPFPTELNDEIGKTLRKIGHEYGVTTGRPRRCGWLDIMLRKYSNAVNGFTKLALAKFDVLDTFEEIKIGVSYKLNDTAIQDSLASKFAQVEVDYEVLPRWKESIQNVTEFNQLPLNAPKYVQRIEELVGVPSKY
ncbi:Adenylsucc synt domain containing protein [Trichuris trichiura]|uniref:Adenylosuccinate synthetase n=1 Tax=Trichuris trichiura TaxID=36087 RepID=A0A077YXJ3_TRITR|nr:Adenylsucc synt domain containing protein [Trichuris trichiura]